MQITVQVPSGILPGNAALAVQVGGVATQPGVTIAVTR